MTAARCANHDEGGEGRGPSAAALAAQPPGRPDGSSGELDLSWIAQIPVDGFRAAPGATVAAARCRSGVWSEGVGAAGQLDFGEGTPAVTAKALYDLASVTKPITALAFVVSAREGRLSLEEPLEALLPELRGTPTGPLPVELLLAHRAGLEGHRPLYAPLTEGKPVDVSAALITAAEARRPGLPAIPPAEGFPPTYSDLGYLLLGAGLARRVGDELDAILDRLILAPLQLRMGSARQLRARDPEFDAWVAPTEVVAFRGGELRGQVHDENAWAVAGSAVAGHAGLFGDARSVLALGMALLDCLAGRDESAIHREDLVPLLRPRPGGSLLAGFDQKSGDSPSAGSRFGPRTFGHLGFTGTSLWIDPDAELVGVLLTNRVHPSRDNPIPIRGARPAVYDAIAEAMLGCAHVAAPR